MSASTEPVKTTPPTTSSPDSTSVATRMLIYTALGVFCVVALFALCLSADAMGRSFSKMGKRLLLADGSGHSSMLTEFVIFILVLAVCVGMIVHASAKHTPSTD